MRKPCPCSGIPPVAHPTRGSQLDAGWYAEQFRAALWEAGITDYVRPFHDVRHASLTNGAAGGEAPIALMTRAGHRSMQTTKVYLHLAGTVFRDEATALEQRLLGTSENRLVTGTTLYPPEGTSADPTTSDTAQTNASRS